MKRFFICFAAAIAALVIAPSCNKDKYPDSRESKSVIAAAVAAASCPLYIINVGLDGSEQFQRVGTATVINYQNPFYDPIVVTAFDKAQVEVPTALYVGDKNRVLIWNLVMGTPEVGWGNIAFSGVDMLRAEGLVPLRAASEDIADAHRFMVDLRTIREPEEITVLMDAEVNKNMKKFVGACFLSVQYEKNEALALGVDRISTAMAEGGGDGMCINERLILFGMGNE